MAWIRGNREGLRAYKSKIMFHVAPNLTPEDQRRHIGNDKVIIYFQEKTKFVPSSFRGNVNYIFEKV